MPDLYGGPEGSTMTDALSSFRRTPIGRFVCAPIELRSYANLLYLSLAFPLGLAYFIFLTVGLALGFGLVIVWVGIPILALVLAGSWLLAMLERQMAIYLLGTEVPPMRPQPREPAGSLWQRLRAFLANPVTWKGMGYLALKFPFGVATFVVAVTLMSLSLGFLLTPLVYAWAPVGLTVSLDGPFWAIDTPGEAFLCSLFGLALTVVSVNLLNALALAWGKLATALLGSRRFAAAAPEAIAAAG
jgi:hypothetical protein